jgi:uncharacterized repeat protein (TIGR01451 family)
METTMQSSRLLQSFVYTLVLLLGATITGNAQTAASGKLMYVTTGGNIYVMNGDGSGKTLLSQIGADYHPVWSPNGQKIAFTKFDFVAFVEQLYVMNADGSGRQRLTFTSRNEGIGYAPAWSPDSQKIVFQSSNLNGTDKEIFVINVDGTGMTNVTNSSDLEYDPQFSPDGQKILFFSTPPIGTPISLYVMNANGTGKVQISPANKSYEYPRWSPDGKKVAAAYANLENNPSGSFNTVVVMNADGSGYAEVTGNAYRDPSPPSWSHDSSQILFMAGDAFVGNGWIYGLYGVNAAGGGARRFAPGLGGTFGSPSWSNKDNKVAFINGSAIYLMNDDGTERQQITTDTNGPTYVSWQPGSPCDCQVITKPAPQIIQTTWADPDPGRSVNWSARAEVTENEGLVLTDVKLGPRYLAVKISVPYYRLQTSEFSNPPRLELRPNNIDNNVRSRLIGYKVTQDQEKLRIEATYVVDQIPTGSQSCLHVVQRYDFYREGVGGRCEPSGTLHCSRWKPLVKYKFYGQLGRSFVSFNVAQRQLLHIDNIVRNTIGLFKDADTTLGAILNLGFARKSNPLFDESDDQIVNQGKSTNQWDNIHQTSLGVVEEPGISPGIYPEWHFIGAGCPECSHSHWRWGAFFGPAFGNGNILGIPAGSSQDLKLAVVRYNLAEDRPSDYLTLVNGERIRHPATGFDPREQLYDYTAPDEVVSWYSGTGYQNGDTFFGHGAFFSGAGPNKQFYASGSSSEGLTSIVAANVIADGATTVNSFDPTILAPLPNGYTLYNNLSYDVQTAAEVSGTDVVSFSVPSVTDQAIFNNLRIFHAEQDQFEPSKVLWVDRTILAPDPQAPDFASKTINSKTNLLGQFAVASLTSPQPPNTASTELALASSHSPFQIVAGNNVTYTFTITNNGPQTATGISFANALPPSSQFDSVISTQGTCAEVNGTVVCKIGTLNTASSAAVTVTAKLTEGGLHFPPAGKMIATTALVRDNETDSNTANNIVTENVNVLPDTNAAPTVTITSPTNGNMFVGPANINIVASASDGDGTISQVDFFDNGELIGTGTVTGQNQYSLNWTNAPFGDHSLIAIATDNAGKSNLSSAANIIVNGMATVNVTSPTTWSAFQAPANITINADASHDNGSISRVDFYANGALLGTGAFLGGYQYSFTWNNVNSGSYALTAVAIDNNGIATTSGLVPIDVFLKFNLAPSVSISSPVTGTAYAAPASVTMTASASDTDGSISRVDLYSNGSLIGTGTSSGTNQYSFTWTNVVRGNYALTAVATDNEGGTSTSASTTIKVGAPVLLVVGSATLNTGDSAVKSRLEALGYFVTVKTGSAATTADANGKAAVLISSTVTPSSVGTKFRTVAVPVVTWESGLYANMGMTGTAAQDNGTVTKQTQVKITNAAHPLAAGLSGTVTVVSVSGTLDWGKPNANAAAVATVANDTTKILIFGYLPGAVMPGLTAPGRRVGLFLYDTTAASFTSNGTALFGAAISWATGLPPLP